MNNLKIVLSFVVAFTLLLTAFVNNIAWESKFFLTVVAILVVSDAFLIYNLRKQLGKG